MDAEVLIENLSWPDIQARLTAGNRRAVICAASSEQHGPHLPESTDYLLGRGTAERLARRLGDALVAPVIRPGCSEHHMAFPGSLTISGAQLMDLLDAYVDSLRRAGFESFAVFSSHGGNFPVLAEWARSRRKPGAEVVADLDAFMKVLVEVERRFGRDDGPVLHADVCETAMMLHLHPELVRMDRAERGFIGDLEPERLFRDGMRGISPNGVLGNPFGATPEMGAMMLDALVEWLAGQFSDPRSSTGKGGK
jgi:creatinine amidohydrolase